MKEHRQIVDRWRHGSGTILATLVNVMGSSYRQPGARLLVERDGRYRGGISAGCLEADLVRKAAWLVRDGASMHRYSTVFDETAEIPFGLGCGGVLDVLLEPVHSAECQALLEAMDGALAGEECSVVTWLPVDGRPMTRAIFRAKSDLAFASDGLTSDVLARVSASLIHSAEKRLDGIFMEHLAAPQRLYIFGAGDDAKPLVTMAALLGWSVTVVDARGQLARLDRFDRGTTVSSPDDVICRIRPQDAAVLMTHSYEQDRQYLEALLPLRLRYLGLLGSRQRSALLIASAAAKLDWPVSECCEQVCAPIGLDLGGDGPEAIALAILAEAQAACMGRRDHRQKISVERVQQSMAEGNAAMFTESQCSLGAV